jgi:hypothetical protein
VRARVHPAACEERFAWHRLSARPSLNPPKSRHRMCVSSRDTPSRMGVFVLSESSLRKKRSRRRFRQ